MTGFLKLLLWHNERSQRYLDNIDYSVIKRLSLGNCTKWTRCLIHNSFWAILKGRIASIPAFMIVNTIFWESNCDFQNSTTESFDENFPRRSSYFFQISFFFHRISESRNSILKWKKKKKESWNIIQSSLLMIGKMHSLWN